VDASGSVTATATPLPTPVPPPTSTILTDEAYTEGLAELETNLREIAGMTLDEYRKIVEARLLEEKLADLIGEEQVEATAEQVHARHILLSVSEPISPTAEITATEEITADTEITSTEAISESEVTTETEAATSSEEMTSTEETVASETVTDTDTVSGTDTGTNTAEAETATEQVSATEATTETATGDAEVESSDEITASTTVSETAPVEPVVEEPRDEAETLALANELRQRILNGEDFAALAAEYSDDPGSGANGGDLGWFGRGAMVAPFEEAAFSLEIGAISEPIRSDFGYHLIEVLEKDAERPKDEATLESERTAAYSTWIGEQIAATPIERSDIVSKLPRNLEPFIPQLAPAPTAAVPATQ
jgi:parvulin-like peptidyl-prolyl isomerase